MQTTWNNKKIRYKIIGEGSPIVLIHGWGGSINSLSHLSNILSKSYKTICIELPGFGISDNPDSYWGVEEYARCVEGCIKQIIPHTDYTYVGHSFGGSLGIFLSANRSRHMTDLVLCNSSYKRTGKTSAKAQKLKSIIDPVPLPAKIKKNIILIAYRIFFPHSDISRFPHLESNFRKIITEDLTYLLPKIGIPTHILWGEEDTYTPVALAKELHEKIKSSRIRIFGGIGHNLPIKHAALVAKEISKLKEGIITLP